MYNAQLAKMSDPKLSIIAWLPDIRRITPQSDQLRSFQPSWTPEKQYVVEQKFLPTWLAAPRDEPLCSFWEIMNEDILYSAARKSYSAHHWLFYPETEEFHTFFADFTDNFPVTSYMLAHQRWQFLLLLIKLDVSWLLLLLSKETRARSDDAFEHWVTLHSRSNAAKSLSTVEVKYSGEDLRDLYLNQSPDLISRYLCQAPTRLRLGGTEVLSGTTPGGLCFGSLSPCVWIEEVLHHYPVHVTTAKRANILMEFHEGFDTPLPLCLLPSMLKWVDPMRLVGHYSSMFVLCRGVHTWSNFVRAVSPYAKYHHSNILKDISRALSPLQHLLLLEKALAWVGDTKRDVSPTVHALWTFVSYLGAPTPTAHAWLHVAKLKVMKAGLSARYTRYYVSMWRYLVSGDHWELAERLLQQKICRSVPDLFIWMDSQERTEKAQLLLMKYVSVTKLTAHSILRPSGRRFLSIPVWQAIFEKELVEPSSVIVANLVNSAEQDPVCVESEKLHHLTERIFTHLPDYYKTTILYLLDWGANLVGGRSDYHPNLPPGTRSRLVYSTKDLSLEKIPPQSSIFSLIHVADDEEFTMELIRRGADVNKAGDGGITPLMIAASQEDVDSYNLLVTLGADEDKVSDLGLTARAFSLMHNPQLLDYSA